MELEQEGVRVGKGAFPATLWEDEGGVGAVHRAGCERLQVEDVSEDAEEDLHARREPCSGEKPRSSLLHDGEVAQWVEHRHVLIHGHAELPRFEGDAESEPNVLKRPAQAVEVKSSQVVYSDKHNRQAIHDAGEGHVAGQHGHRLVPEVVVTHHRVQRHREVSHQQAAHDRLHPGVGHAVSDVCPACGFFSSSEPSGDMMPFRFFYMILILATIGTIRKHDLVFHGGMTFFSVCEGGYLLFLSPGWADRDNLVPYIIGVVQGSPWKISDSNDVCLDKRQLYRRCPVVSLHVDFSNHGNHAHQGFQCSFRSMNAWVPTDDLSISN